MDWQGGPAKGCSDATGWHAVPVSVTARTAPSEQLTAWTPPGGHVLVELLLLCPPSPQQAAWRWGHRTCIGIVQHRIHDSSYVPAVRLLLHRGRHPAGLPRWACRLLLRGTTHNQNGRHQHHGTSATEVGHLRDGCYAWIPAQTAAVKVSWAPKHPGYAATAVLRRPPRCRPPPAPSRPAPSRRYVEDPMRAVWQVRPDAGGGCRCRRRPCSNHAEFKRARWILAQGLVPATRPAVLKGEHGTPGMHSTAEVQPSTPCRLTLALPAAPPGVLHPSTSTAPARTEAPPCSPQESRGCSSAVR